MPVSRATWYAATAVIVAIGSAALPPTPRGVEAPAAVPRMAPVLDSLVGTWSGEGTLLGRPATFRMSWAAGVPGVYSLAFSNAFLADDGAETPVLEARALYRADAEGAVDGVWFDSRGVRIELRGDATPERLRIEWRAPTESGVTVYGRPRDGTVLVVDSVRGAQGMREFGRVRYARADARSSPPRPFGPRADLLDLHLQRPGTGPRTPLER